MTRQPHLNDVSDVTPNRIIKDSPLAMEEIIHQSNLIEGYDNPEFDKQSLVAWKYLKNKKELSHVVICNVQRLITESQDDLQPDMMGYYRDMSRTNVFIGDHVPIHHSFVKHYMDNWLIEYKNRDPKTNHIAFEHVHPFVDGNGRTGRMLMWWQEIKEGGEPTLILNAKKRDYYKWFAQPREGVKR